MMSDRTTDVDVVLSGLPRETDEAALLEAWRGMARELGLAQRAGDEALVATARDVTLYAARQLEPAWGGGWRWNLTNSVVRTTAAAALLGAVFASAGLATLPVLVLPAVLPMMFDVERVRLRRSEEKVLEIIGARPKFFERIGQPEDLYASLPDWVKSSMTLLEFEDFLQTVVEAGRATESGGLFEVLPNSETVMRITVK
jgi:hypothetical protein